MFSQVFVWPQLASWLLVRCSALLWRGRYASYWNAFFYCEKSLFRTFTQYNYCNDSVSKIELQCFRSIDADKDNTR